MLLSSASDMPELCVRAVAQPTQLKLLEHRLQPTTPLTAQGGSAAHCSMHPGGVNLDLT